MQSLGGMRDPRPEKLFLAYRQDGDVKALGRLFDLLSPELLTVARHLSGDAAEAEDLVQAAFLAALEHPERYDESRPLAAWFVGILRNQALAWRRSAARSPDGERALEAQNTSEQRSRPDRKATDGESAGLVRAALDRLPEKYRDVLDRHLGKGQSPTAIARETGASPATVRVQLHRGLAQLRDLLPAGIAGGLALTLTERGLAQVRTEITTHASTLAPSIAAKTGGTLVGIKLGGLLMTQRTILVTLGLIVVLTATYLGRDALWPTSNDGAFGLIHTPLEESTEDIALVSMDGSERTAAGVWSEGALQPAGSLGSVLIRTVWHDGSPAPNISFDLRRFGGSGETRLAKSDETGTVLVRDMGLGRWATYLRRNLPSRGPSVLIRNGDTAQQQEATIRIADGIDVKGRVVDSEGRGVAGAEIWISNEIYRAEAIEVVRSGSDGSFLIRQVGGDCHVGARKPGFIRSRAEHVQMGVERSADSKAIDVTLRLDWGAARLEGVVLDPSGHVVAGAKVRVGDQSDFSSMGPDGPIGTPPQELVTDENGAFSCEGLVPGTVEFACKAQGFAVSTGSVQVQEGAVGQVQIRLEQGAWIRGVVRAHDGSPTAQITVNVDEWAFRYPQVNSSFGAPHTESGTDGTFEIGPLAAGPIRLHAASYTGFQRSLREGLVANGETYLWELTLEGLPTISGRALDADGAPLAGWTVVVKADGNPSLPHKSVICDSDGAFTIHLIGMVDRRLELYKPKEGSRTASVWSPRGAPLAWVTEVPLGSTDVELRLDPRQTPSGKLTGGLESVRPLGKTKITVSGEDLGEFAEVRLDAGVSSFEVSDLPVGTFTLRIESQGCAPLWLRGIQLQKGEHQELGTNLVFAGGDLAVNLDAEWLVQLDHAMVELHDSQQNSWYTRMQGKRIEAKNLPPGTYTLNVQASGCGPARLNVTIAGGERTEQELSLIPGGSIGFVLLDGQDRPLGEGVKLTVAKADGGVVLVEDLDVEQVSRWIFAPFGDLRVVAEAESGRRCETTIHFSSTDGAEAPHTLKLVE